MLLMKARRILIGPRHRQSLCLAEERPHKADAGRGAIFPEPIRQNNAGVPRQVG